MKSLDSENLGTLVFENRTNNAYIQNILENLGRLPQGFDGNWLLELLDSDSSSIRFLAVKVLMLTFVNFTRLTMSIMKQNLQEKDIFDTR
ncbi:MAG: hypothetical protein LBJ41_10245 [Treponema sp.]|nr:hypothetical protein [Treponema sp.]